MILIRVSRQKQVVAAEVMGKSRKQVDNLIARGKVAMKPLLVKKGVTDAFD